jgi:hypothetical protein
VEKRLSILIFCDLCGSYRGANIKGPRFACLNCIDSDFCAYCHASWEKSNGELEICKGHRFYEIPRPCWYQFKEGVVMEDGSTLPQVIEFSHERFTTLLKKQEVMHLPRAYFLKLSLFYCLFCRLISFRAIIVLAESRCCRFSFEFYRAEVTLLSRLRCSRRQELKKGDGNGFLR